mmetsp:Transcript_4607/g.12257  ORF Transcript_4607/g.12257 Transcript_4607/m.12257 type:complete len:230 (+) Transcript_4607:360-1049(+)
MFHPRRKHPASSRHHQPTREYHHTSHIAIWPRFSLEPSSRPFCMPSPYFTEPFDWMALRMAVGGTRSRTHTSSMALPAISALKPRSRTIHAPRTSRKGMSATESIPSGIVAASSPACANVQSPITIMFGAGSRPTATLNSSSVLTRTRHSRPCWRVSSISAAVPSAPLSASGKMTPFAPLAFAAAICTASTKGPRAMAGIGLGNSPRAVSCSATVASSASAESAPGVET